jgi:hypothetical protein
MKRASARNAYPFTNIPRGVQGFGYPQSSLQSSWPKTRRVTLKYAEHITLNPGTASNPAIAYYRAGSCFDPTYAVGGHQPLGFDQWTAFYQHYTVIASTIKVTFMPARTTTGGPIMYTITLKSAAAYTLGTWTPLVEDPRTVHKYCRDAVNSNFRGGGQTTLTHKYSAKEFFNLRDPMDNTARIGALFTADPADNAYFMITAFSPYSSVDASDQYALIEMSFDTVFSEPQTILSS